MRRFVAACLAGGSLTACQTYEQEPLRPELHRAAWHARVVERSSVAEFVDRVDWAAPGSTETFDPTDGITLPEGQLLALAFHPELRLARLRATGSASHAELAGLWDDPELALEVLRITENVSNRWIVSPGLGFTVPISGRKDAERRIAESETRSALWSVRESEWEVWYAVEAAWRDWSAERSRITETRRLIDTLEGLVTRADELSEQGELPRTEAALFRVELARQRNLLVGLRGAVDEAEASLRALLGLSPRAALELTPTSLGRAGAPNDSFEALAERNPRLARLAEEYTLAEERLHREVLAQIPDLTLGPLYESDEGQARIGFFGGLPLPVFNANRQGIADARSARALARAGYETEYERLVGRWTVADARRAAHRAQREDLEATLAPLVDRQLQEALRLARLGEASTLVVLESLTRAHETKLALIDVRTREAHALAELDHLIGPPAPTSTEETP